MTVIKNVKKSEDYAIIHADGIISEIGDDVTKLVFFQNVNLPNNEDVMDQDEIGRASCRERV